MHKADELFAQEARMGWSVPSTLAGFRVMTRLGAPRSAA